MIKNVFLGRPKSKTELRYWREIHNITQREMAEMLGTSRPTYLRFENNLHRNAPRDMGLEIRASELTGIPVNELRHTYDVFKSATLRQSEILTFDSARTLADAEGSFPYTLNTVISDKERRRRKRTRQRLQRLWSDFWGGEKETTSLLEWQEIELDRVEWAAIFEAIRQQRRQSHKKSVISPRNSEAEVKDAIEKRKPLTVLEYNRLDRFWSQQKVATEIGISQSQYSKIERRMCKATDAELDKLERLFGISKKGLFLPWDKQETNVYRLATGGKNKPGESRRLSYKESGNLLLGESHPKIPWYLLRFILQVEGLSPFRVLMRDTRGDVGELLFRGR